MNTKELFTEIQNTIRRGADPENIRMLNKYFKESINTAGWKVPRVRALAKEYVKKFKKEKYDVNKVLDLVEKLFMTARMEEVTLALEILRHYHNIYTPKFFELFNSWTRYLTNWAHTDDLGTHHVSKLLSMDKNLFKELLKWTQSDNRWVRRLSVVSLVPEARKGNMLNEVFRICSKLMKDGDDMVQKGVGWLLKEASKKHPIEVADFLMRWKDKTARKVLYIACEKLPKSIKEKILKKADGELKNG
ncbi:MAG TPA: DNA alkylation repair protein [Bacteroidota bacterium]|jgi:3-methyladenine DNA glycosylase AlkD|nr:DNA alkylation repair protein [Bacteroidota bacterium]